MISLWKITVFNREIIYQWAIFRGDVNFTKRVYIKVPLLTTPPPAHRNEDGVHPRQAVSTGEMRRKSFKHGGFKYVICQDMSIPTKWCPSSIAKLIDKSNFTRTYGRYIYSFFLGLCSPTNITGGVPHCFVLARWMATAGCSGITRSGRETGRWIKSQPTFLSTIRSWLYRYIEINK